MKEHPQFPWDHYSDQPKVIKDKSLKREIYRESWFQFVKSHLLLLLVPFFALILIFRKQTTQGNPGRTIGLAVHVETDCEGKTIVSLNQLEQMVDELGLTQLLVRLPLADIGRLDIYLEHIDRLRQNGREVTINLLQCKLLLENYEEQQKVVTQVITALKSRVEYIQVGNAYNRRKWGFKHFGHYQKFYNNVRQITKEIAPDMKLLGGAVIDFEIPNFLESLFHFKPGNYDGYATQLYVDRRGAPENRQLGFHFLAKINFISLLQKLSWKSKGSVWITEYNWPLADTNKFTPCHGDAQVSEKEHANYLARSYLIAIASGRVRTCYWHQLVAPGYGLVDNRGDSVIKRPAFYALGTLIKCFSKATDLDYTETNYMNLTGVSCLSAQTLYEGKTVQLQAIWSNKENHSTNPATADIWLDQEGNIISSDSSPAISQSVIYGITKSFE